MKTLNADDRTLNMLNISILNDISILQSKGLTIQFYRVQIMQAFICVDQKEKFPLKTKQ